MKFILASIGSLLMLVFFAFIIMSGVRWFNSTTVSTKVVSPKPGVECMIVTTTDGAAVSCWKN